MTHEQVRDLLAAGERTAALDIHLDGCGSCRSFERDLARVTAAALAAFGPAPSGLVSRIGQATRAAPVGSRTMGRSVRRHVGVRAALASGIAATLIAAAIAVPRVSDGPDTSLIAAVERAAEAGTARFTFSASFSFDRGEALGDGSVTELLERQMREQLDQLGDGVPPELREQLEQQMQDQLEQLEDQLEEALEKYGDRLQDLLEFRSFKGRLSGKGEMVFPDRTRIRGTMKGNVPASIVPGDGTSYESISIGDKKWLRSAATGDRWVEGVGVPAQIRIDWDPNYLLDQLPGAGRVENLGTEDLDGVSVRHYRINIDDDPALTEGAWSLHAWVGESDGLLRKMTTEIELSTAFSTIMMKGQIRFFDFGANVTIEAPDPSDVIPADEMPLLPGGGAWSFDGSSIGVPALG